MASALASVINSVDSSSQIDFIFSSISFAMASAIICMFFLKKMSVKTELLFFPNYHKCSIGNPCITDRISNLIKDYL